MVRFIQLQYFVEIVDRGSFSAAAKSLYVSQSALSQSLSGLEAELGVELIRRSKSGVRLTYFGHRIYENAKDLIRSFSEFEDAARGLLAERSTLSGQVNILCTKGGEAYLSSTIVPELNAAYPGLELVTTASTAMREGIKCFLESGCALGMGACLADAWNDIRAQAEASGAVCEFFGSETPQIVLSARNPLANEKSLSRAQVKQLKLVCFSFAPAPRYLPLFAGLGTRAPNRASVVRLVSASDSAGVFVPSAIRRELSEHRGQVRLIPFGFQDETVLPVIHYILHAPESELSHSEQCTLEIIRRYPYAE